MRIPTLLLLGALASVAHAKGQQGAPPGPPQKAPPPVDPATKQFIEAARAAAPDHLPSGFQLPTAAESLIAAWKAAWDRAPILKQRLETMWSSSAPLPERLALFRSIYIGTAIEPVLHEGVAKFVRAHLTALDADKVLAPPPVAEVTAAEPAPVAAKP